MTAKERIARADAVVARMRAEKRATVDRTSDRWQRIRRCCGQAAASIDLDAHADSVWRTVESLTTTGKASA